jgi:hypothetical protein
MSLSYVSLQNVALSVLGALVASSMFVSAAVGSATLI